MRSLTEEEATIVRFLLKKACLSVDVRVLNVRAMDDGGMGSLAFAPFAESRRFGRQAAACRFVDSDGVPVSAALNLDQEGKLFELDVWKVDFSPLRKWPAESEIAIELGNPLVH